MRFDLCHIGLGWPKCHWCVEVGLLAISLAHTNNSFLWRFRRGIVDGRSAWDSWYWKWWCRCQRHWRRDKFEKRINLLLHEFFPLPTKHISRKTWKDRPINAGAGWSNVRWPRVHCTRIWEPHTAVEVWTAEGPVSGIGRRVITCGSSWGLTWKCPQCYHISMFLLCPAWYSICCCMGTMSDCGSCVIN